MSAPLDFPIFSVGDRVLFDSYGHTVLGRVLEQRCATVSLETRFGLFTLPARQCRPIAYPDMLTPARSRAVPQ